MIVGSRAGSLSERDEKEGEGGRGEASGMTGEECCLVEINCPESLGKKIELERVKLIELKKKVVTV